MHKFIENEDPDIIICPHIFSAILITQMKKDGMMDERIPLIGIVTDFDIHPFWEDTVMDYFVTASELMANQVQTKGIPKEKILALRHPDQRMFFRQYTRCGSEKKAGAGREKDDTHALGRDGVWQNTKSGQAAGYAADRCTDRSRMRQQCASCEEDGEIQA